MLALFRGLRWLPDIYLEITFNCRLQSSVNYSTVIQYLNVGTHNLLERKHIHFVYFKNSGL